MLLVLLIVVGLLNFAAPRRGGVVGTLFGPSDGLTAEQHRLLDSLRAALKKNNLANLDADDAEQTPELFVRGPSLRHVLNATPAAFREAIQGSEPIIFPASAGVQCTQHAWTLDFVNQTAGGDVVGVETSKSNRFYSNEGLRKEQMRVSEFLRRFRRADRDKDYYLAEESLEEMPRLRDDVVEPDFTDGMTLDKLQLWIGAGGQVSPLHHDQWENVLCQIQGTRRIWLYDPLQVDRLYPKSGVNRHFSKVDVEHPDLTRFPKFRDAVGYVVDLHAGDVLVLPAMWWHQVHHKDAVNVAVNFWFLPSLMSEILYDLVLPPGEV